MFNIPKPKAGIVAPVLSLSGTSTIMSANVTELTM